MAFPAEERFIVKAENELARHQFDGARTRLTLPESGVCSTNRAFDDTGTGEHLKTYCS